MRDETVKNFILDKNYKKLLLFFFCCLILYKGVENYRFFFLKFSRLTHALLPFAWGVGMAFILNPAIKFLQKTFKNMSRAVALLVVYIGFFSLIFAFSLVVVPVITSNMSELYSLILVMPDTLNTYIQKIPNGNKLLMDLGLGQLLRKNTAEIAKWLLNFTNIDLFSVFSKVVNITSGLIQFLLGLFVSIYLLYDKENLLEYMKKLIVVFLKEKADPVLDYLRKVNFFFYNFLVGKLIDSTIIGIMCYIGFLILRVKYAVLLSIIIGVTNMIPYFGPFIGAIPAVIITLIYSPIKALWVAIFVLALQQFDGWFLGPKILGTTVGAKPLTIIFAILVGGNLGGALGMLLAVPVYRSIAVLWDTFIDMKIKKQQTGIVESADIVSDEIQKEEID